MFSALPRAFSSRRDVPIKAMAPQTTGSTSSTGATKTTTTSAPPPPPQANSQQIEVFVDGKPVLCEPGMTILQACSLAGVQIPR